VCKALVDDLATRELDPAQGVLLASTSQGDLPTPSKPSRAPSLSSRGIEPTSREVSPTYCRAPPRVGALRACPSLWDPRGREAEAVIQPSGQNRADPSRPAGSLPKGSATPSPSTASASPAAPKVAPTTNPMESTRRHHQSRPTEERGALLHRPRHGPTRRCRQHGL